MGLDPRRVRILRGQFYINSLVRWFRATSLPPLMTCVFSACERIASATDGASKTARSARFAGPQTVRFPDRQCAGRVVRRHLEDRRQFLVRGEVRGLRNRQPFEQEVSVAEGVEGIANVVGGHRPRSPRRPVIP